MAKAQKILVFMVVGLLCWIPSLLAAENSVKIGVVLPFTGPIAFDGKLTFEGIQLAQKELNSGGGVTVGGKKYEVELVVEDSGCVPANSVAAVEKLMSRDKVATVIGDFCSSSTFADAEVARRHQVVQITPISIAPKITKQGNPWIFRGCDDAEMMGKAFVSYAIDKLKITKWAFLAVNDDYGRGSVDAITKLIQAHGGAEIVSIDYHEKGATDYYSLLTKIKAKAPNGLALIANTVEDAMKTNQWAELGMNKTMRLMDPTSALFNPKYVELTGKNCEGLVGAARYVWSIDTPRNKQFVAAFKKAYKQNPEKFSQSGYDSLKMVALAIGKANSIDHGKIRDALAKTDYTGPQGHATFTPENQLVIDEYILEIKSGNFVILGKVPREKLFPK
jgi:branched-chain amino acid transport system substrate-binding protein